MCVRACVRVCACCVLVLCLCLCPAAATTRSVRIWPVPTLRPQCRAECAVTAQLHRPFAPRTAFLAAGSGRGSGSGRGPARTGQASAGAACPPPPTLHSLGTWCACREGVRAAAEALRASSHPERQRHTRTIHTHAVHTPAPPALPRPGWCSTWSTSCRSSPLPSSCRSSPRTCATRSTRYARKGRREAGASGCVHACVGGWVGGRVRRGGNGGWGCRAAGAERGGGRGRICARMHGD